MSVQNEINRLSKNVSDSYKELNALGVDVPKEKNSDHLPKTIAATGKLIDDKIITHNNSEQSHSDIRVELNQKVDLQEINDEEIAISPEKIIPYEPGKKVTFQEQFIDLSMCDSNHEYYIKLNDQSYAAQYTVIDGLDETGNVSQVAITNTEDNRNIMFIVTQNQNVLTTFFYILQQNEQSDTIKIQVFRKKRILKNIDPLFLSSKPGTINKVNGETYNSNDNIALGLCSHAEGGATSSKGEYSHAECAGTQALGTASHAENLRTKAFGIASHCEGQDNEAIGECSHCEGEGNKANGKHQHVQGKYNVSDNSKAHIVGGGSSDSARKNIHTIDWDGNGWYAGTLKLGGSNYNDPNAKNVLVTSQSGLDGQFALSDGKGGIRFETFVNRAEVGL